MRTKGLGVNRKTQILGRTLDPIKFQSSDPSTRMSLALRRPHLIWILLT